MLYCGISLSAKGGKNVIHKIAKINMYKQDHASCKWYCRAELSCEHGSWCVPRAWRPTFSGFTSLALVRQELYFNAVQLAVPFPQRSYGVLVQLVNKEQAIRSSYLQSRGFKDWWSRHFYHTPCWKRMISGLSTVASSKMSLETSNIKNYLYLNEISHLMELCPVQALSLRTHWTLRIPFLTESSNNFSTY